MSVHHIPVLLMGQETTYGFPDPVGYGEIEDGKDELVIKVKNKDLVDRIARLSEVGAIQELQLGVGFRLGPGFVESEG